MSRAPHPRNEEGSDGAEGCGGAGVPSSWSVDDRSEVAGALGAIISCSGIDVVSGNSAGFASCRGAEVTFLVSDVSADALVASDDRFASTAGWLEVASATGPLGALSAGSTCSWAQALVAAAKVAAVNRIRLAVRDSRPNGTRPQPRARGARAGRGGVEWPRTGVLVTISLRVKRLRKTILAMLGAPTMG